MKKFFAFLLLAVVVVMTGCSNDSKLQGTWTAKMTRSQMAAVQGDGPEVEITKGTMTYTFAEDVCKAKMEFTLVDCEGDRFKVIIEGKTTYEVVEDEIEYSDAKVTKMTFNGHNVLRDMDDSDIRDLVDGLEQPEKILKLTDKVLEIEDVDGEVMKFKKV